MGAAGSFGGDYHAKMCVLVYLSVHTHLCARLSTSEQTHACMHACTHSLTHAHNLPPPRLQDALERIQLNQS
jgi:hypothetical protein